MTATESQLGLDKVRLPKEKLIEKLEANRKKHKSEFEEALKGWKSKVLTEMENNLALAQRDKEWNLWIDASKPEDHSVDYDRVTALLKASIDDVIVLTVREFQQYFLDEWSWMDHHKMSHDNYTRLKR